MSLFIELRKDACWYFENVVGVLALERSNWRVWRWMEDLLLNSPMYIVVFQVSFPRSFFLLCPAHYRTFNFHPPGINYSMRSLSPSFFLAGERWLKAELHYIFSFFFFGINPFISDKHCPWHHGSKRYEEKGLACRSDACVTHWNIGTQNFWPCRYRTCILSIWHVWHISDMGSVHVCEPHTHYKRVNSTLTRRIDL